MDHLINKKKIEKISNGILKDSKSLDVFPTPTDKIVDFAELQINNGVDLSKVDHSFFKDNFNFDNFKNILSNIKGLLFRKEKLIFLDKSQLLVKQNFVKLHELGHEALSWQNDIIQVLEETQNTLDDDTNIEFEAEANYFASETLFQGSRFSYYANQIEFGIKAPLALSKKFGGSTHAAIRKYVETSNKRCALIVLKDKSKSGQPIACKLRNLLYSKGFSKDFGELIIPEILGYTWCFARDFQYVRYVKLKGVVNLNTTLGQIDFQYEFFTNSYNAFVLIYPVGENKSIYSKTKIILE